MPKCSPIHPTSKRYVCVDLIYSHSLVMLPHLGKVRSVSMPPDLPRC